MPNICCVPRCRGNYDPTNKVALFSFPKDENLRNAWIRAIPRKNCTYTSHSRVCEKHFSIDVVERTTSAYDEKTGKLVIAPLKFARLKREAVPSIFPGCPSYMSSSGSHRLDPESKRLYKERDHISMALEMSKSSHEIHQKSRQFKSFEELCNIYKNFSFNNCWTIVANDNSLMFLLLKKIDGVISLEFSIDIDPDLFLNISQRGVAISSLKDLGNFPIKVSNITEIDAILHHIEKLHDNDDIVGEANFEKSKNLIHIIKSFLNELRSNLDVSKNLIIDFITEQIDLIVCKAENYRYSTDILIFSSMLHLVSPQAYKFIRESGNIILPHPVTLKKINSSLRVNPQDEINDTDFLSYLRRKIHFLDSDDKLISLLIDEIHIKPYLDYKGGNIVGMAHDNTAIANSAFVFMIKSFRTSYKDVAHILPVKTITADVLFCILKKVILTLEHIGFKVSMVVTDNNSINRKCMSQFSNPLADFVYQHPSDPLRPLFYCIDTVHLIKCVRNNWLNQKNCEQAMIYPSFDAAVNSETVISSTILIGDDDDNNNTLNIASMNTVKKMYEAECGNMLKYGYTLSRKALWPTNLERQNVKLALDLFNSNISKSLTELKSKHNLNYTQETSKYIEIFRNWFDIMNVKTPCKGFHLRNEFQKPLTSADNDERIIFLEKFINWLTKWKNSNCDTGKLTYETHSALLLTTKAIVEFTNFCSNEIGMKYLLPGKIQTDDLEFRFSLYRRLAGTQYHISMRQIFEIEGKMRDYSVMKLCLKSGSRGTFVIDHFCEENEAIESTDCSVELTDYLHITVNDDDISSLTSDIPLLTYLAGYCIHSLLKRSNCAICESNLTREKPLKVHPNFKLIHSCDRGGLKFPSLSVINTIVHNFIIVDKIISDKGLEKKFLLIANQRQLIIDITVSVLEQKEMSIENCTKHSSRNILITLIRSCTNTLLKNYCKEKNVGISKVSKRRKLSTFAR